MFAALPAVHLMAVAYATRYRWRQMREHAVPYRFIYRAGFSMAGALVGYVVLDYPFYGYFDLPNIVDEIVVYRYQWACAFYFFLPVYSVLLVLILPIAPRIWIVLGVCLMTIWVGGGQLAYHMIETVEMTIGDRKGFTRAAPEWAGPFRYVVTVSALMLFAIGCIQTVVNIILSIAYRISRLSNRQAT